MTSMLTQLPVEIVEYILEDLEVQSQFSLRLACRTLYQKTSWLFARSQFATLTSNLSRESILRLDEISRTEHLRYFTQTLVISYRGLGQGFTWPRQQNGRLHDLQQLPAMQKLQDILVHRLPRCRSFRICGAISDGPSEEQLRPMDAVNIILNLATTTKMPIKSLWTDFGGFEIRSNRLDPQYFNDDNGQLAWAQYEELRLEHAITPNSFDFTMALLKQASHLKRLSIGSRFDDCSELLRRLSESNINLGCLEELRLTALDVDTNVLLKLLTPASQHFRKLELSHIYMSGDSTVGNLLKGLQCRFPYLESILIFRAKQLNASPDDKYVDVRFPARFPVLSSNGGKPIGASRSSPHPVQSSGSLSMDDTLLQTYLQCVMQKSSSEIKYNGPDIMSLLERIANRVHVG
ncbi:MAG: hypothetical protein Q9227_000175 [Pyrenula ochraceoflavens]